MSALREAITHTLLWTEHTDIEFRYALEALADELVAAVEGVPVKVTIRDLDMADSENIVTVSNDAAVRYLALGLAHADEHGEDVHLTVDAGALKVKIGGGTWSYPIETTVYEP